MWQYFECCLLNAVQPSAARFTQGWALQGGELTDQFLRLLMEASILYHTANDSPGRPTGTQQLSYLVADAFARLMCILISGAQSTPPAPACSATFFRPALLHSADQFCTLSYEVFM